MQSEKTEKALVVMSGGQDSVTCLGVALSECHSVSAVSFIYGQKHVAEVAIAKSICDRHGVEHRAIDLTNAFSHSQSALLQHTESLNDSHPLNDELPASFVPVRNATFLTVAFGLAQAISASAIYTGVCQTDYSGYPDCRDVFIRALNDALNVGYAASIEIRTPLMHRTKADTFALAWSHGFLDTVINETMTCYNGDTTMNDFGKGCGECPACKLRWKGWNEYKLREAYPA